MAASLGKIPTHIGTPLDLTIEALDRIGRVQFGAVLNRERHIGQDISLSLVQEGG